eukprot:TRINITY_DN6350_c0_g1_i1.p1 TRINITY_DN6350_c0_g1~~TRINITY_DN6350_c0_g1_i1.p1  ORF type:complete len:88 (+),score=14.80 TRINITY_DN6350_c0_g1_i1:27-266(+)
MSKRKHIEVAYDTKEDEAKLKSQIDQKRKIKKGLLDNFHRPTQDEMKTVHSLLQKTHGRRTRGSYHKKTPVLNSLIATI